MLYSPNRHIAVRINTTSAHNNMYDSHQHQVAHKKPGIKDYRLHDSIYINYKNRQNPIYSVRSWWSPGRVGIRG